MINAIKWWKSSNNIQPKSPTSDPVQSLQEHLDISDSCVGAEWKLC